MNILNKKRYKKFRVLNLYWVESGFGYEDWFIIARNSELARKCFNYFEGFDEDDSESTFVVNIGKEVIKKYNLRYFEGCWPKHDLLNDLGFKFISEVSPRILNYNGIVFKEAYNTESFAFDNLNYKLGVYIIRVKGTDNYKIGVTKSLKTRIKQFQTASPFHFEIVYFIETSEYKTLEKDLHNYFSSTRNIGEWFVFDDEKFLEFKIYLIKLIDEFPNLYKLYDIESVGKILNEY